MLTILAAAAFMGVQTQDKAPDKTEPARDAVPVTVDNFIRAETDTYFGEIVKEGGVRQVPSPPRARRPIDKQTVDSHEPRHAVFRRRCSTSMPGR